MFSRVYNKDEISGWIVSVVIHILLFLIAFFFVTCWEQQIPSPDPGQGIEISFGTTTEVKGDTDIPLTNGDQAEVIDEVPAEPTPSPIIEEEVEEILPEAIEESQVVDSPKESADLNRETVEKEAEREEVSEISEKVQEPNDIVEKEIVDTNKEEKNDEVEVAEKLPGLPGFKPGGSTEETGQIGEETANSVSLSSGLGTAEIPKGWLMSTEPTPDIQKDGVVVISVSFNRNGDYVWNSARYISGDHSIFSTYKDTKIEESLRNQLKLSTDGTLAPKLKNIATFRFEFKGH